MFIAMGVIGLQLFLFMSWKKSVRWFRDIASESIYVKHEAEQDLTTSIDSLQKLYPRRPDTIIQIIKHIEQVRQEEDSLTSCELWGMREYFLRLDGMFDGSMERIDEKESYVTVFGYGLVVLTLISYIFEQHEVTNKQ